MSNYNKEILLKFAAKLEYAAKHRNITLTSQEVDELFIVYADVWPSGARSFSKSCSVCVFDMVDILTNKLHVFQLEDQTAQLQQDTQEIKEVIEQPKAKTERKPAASRKKKS